MCKDIGISFDELDIMTIGDALDATQEYIDSRKPKTNKRRASQNDFDSF